MGLRHGQQLLATRETRQLQWEQRGSLSLTKTSLIASRGKTRPRRERQLTTKRFVPNLPAHFPKRRRILIYGIHLQAAKPTLPSFWTPSLTPDVQTTKLAVVAKKEKASPICPASARDDPHPISMQSLITINFNEEDVSGSDVKRRTCPSCLKALNNSSNPMMAKQCGHVLCHSCVKKFMIPSGKKTSPEDELPVTCYVCDVPLTSKPQKRDTAKADSVPGLIALRSEGTGFSARGTSTVERSGIAFQC